jgi:hypothetical protein
MSYQTDRIAHLARAARLKERKRLRKQRAEIHAALAHCRLRSRTRKRSVEKLMGERGWARAASTGPIERQWVRA